MGGAGICGASRLMCLTDIIFNSAILDDTTKYGGTGNDVMQDIGQFLAPFRGRGTIVTGMVKSICAIVYMVECEQLWDTKSISLEPCAVFLFHMCCNLFEIFNIRANVMICPQARHF